VIGLANGGTVELIEDGHTGFLFNGTTEALADSMERIILNPERARKMGENGWLKVRSNFTIEKYAEKVFEVYNTIQKLL
jgi:starch synthase